MSAVNNTTIVSHHGILLILGSPSSSMHSLEVWTCTRMYIYECKITSRNYILVSHINYIPTIKEWDPSERADPFRSI